MAYSYHPKLCESPNSVSFQLTAKDKPLFQTPDRADHLSAMLSQIRALLQFFLETKASYLSNKLPFQKNENNRICL